ncbi:hypothetical protein ACFFGR_16570 [Arthrobacter liuii]|uniref:hypothetical protein n=1 Tax=Arthrobacter liuii TaxID=1476996 RepID=UPI001E6042DD|nr:hypothetical protein [Arthrobacter liuii]
MALIALVAVVLGVNALSEVDARNIGEFGLIGALPTGYFVAVGLSLVGFVGSLALKRDVPALLGLQVLVLIVILHGADPIVHGLPRLEASYRHLGIADYIAQSGQLDPTIDAYFSWPGFFALLAMFSEASGLHDLTAIATWAPLGVNVLLMLPLLALASRLTSQWRQAWAAIWVFYLASWVGQDYLSPQSYAFILMIVLVASLMTAFVGWARPVARNKFTSRWRSWVAFLDPTIPRFPGGTGLSKSAGASLTVACAVLVVAITASHQLTPFAVFTVGVALLAIGRISIRFLVPFAGILAFVWLVVVAEPYWSGHINQLLGSIGAVNSTVSKAFISRISGSEAHVLVVAARLVESGLIIVLAVIGMVVAHKRRTPWLTATAGAFAPISLFLLQPYGGELFLRLYMFALPFAACLVVVAFMPKSTRQSLGWVRATALVVLGGLLATTTLITRYGNDRMENFTTDEISVIDELYDKAPEGSIVIEALHNTPWRFQQYAAYKYITLLPAQAQPVASRLTCDTVNKIAGHAGAYLVVTKSQQDAADALGVGPAGSIPDFLSDCSKDPKWSAVYQNGDGVLFHIEGENLGK